MDAVQIGDRDSKTKLRVPLIIIQHGIVCTYMYISVQHLLETDSTGKRWISTTCQGMACITLLCVAYYEYLEFCDLPHLVLLYYTSEHSSTATMRSWTLLWAFGPHGLLILYVCMCTVHTYVFTYIIPHMIQSLALIRSVISQFKFTNTWYLMSYASTSQAQPPLFYPRSLTVCTSTTSNW